MTQRHHESCSYSTIFQLFWWHYAKCKSLCTTLSTHYNHSRIQSLFGANNKDDKWKMILIFSWIYQRNMVSKDLELNHTLDYLGKSGQDFVTALRLKSFDRITWSNWSCLSITSAGNVKFDLFSHFSSVLTSAGQYKLQQCLMVNRLCLWSNKLHHRILMEELTTNK